MNWASLKNSKVIAITMMAWIGIAGIVIARQLLSRGDDGVPNKAYFTTDDSSPSAALAELFVDDTDRLAPFDHDGKLAYRAYVFTCDGGRTKFVAHLERYTPAGLKQMRDMLDKGGRSADGSPAIQSDLLLTETEIKRPGDTTWTLRGNDQLAGPILNIRCPDGTRHSLDAVWPE